METVRIYHENYDENNIKRINYDENNIKRINYDENNIKRRKQKRFGVWDI